MTLFSKIPLLFQSTNSKMLGACYCGLLTLILMSKKKQKTLESPVFNEILLRLEEDQDVLEQFGMPLSYDTGLIAARHASFIRGGSV